jgi:hypothetical protein
LRMEALLKTEDETVVTRRVNSINIGHKWWDNWMSYSYTQAKNQTLWFLVSLILQGVFFLPIPAVLMFYYGAPIIVLVITLLLYFANIIAGMGGSGIRTVLYFFAISVIVNLLMLLIFLI